MRIVQLSDIHWRGISRHEEYTSCFERLFAELRSEVKPDYIITTGDYWHTKTQGITPEAIEKLTWMFRELASIAPVYAILGNHDGNLTNDDRQDTISPIIDAMNDPRIVLFKSSGNHIIPNTTINLCVLSCFDKRGWGRVIADEDLINVALYHGSVSGCKVDSDWVMSGGEEEASIFDRFDFAMLGDIHKTQFLSHRPDLNGVIKPWIAYPGSFIQQNYGEETTKGYLVWDIRSVDDWDVAFKPVRNNCQFITVEWQGDVANTIAAASEVCHGDLTHKRVRVSSAQTIFHLQMKELYDEFKDTHRVSEVVFKSKPSVVSQENSLTYKQASQHKSLRNDTASVLHLFLDHLDKNNKGTLKLSYDQEAKAKDHIGKYMDRVREDADSPRDVVWTIRSLEFDNLYRYGEGNSINFEKMSGITGLFGGNAVGKSSIIGALMFGLFNTTDRGPVKSAHIVNRNKSAGMSRVVLNVSGTDYVIQRDVVKATRRGGKVDDEKAGTTLMLYKVEQDGTSTELINENSETRTDTDKVIRKLIGTSQDFLLTALSSQGGMNRFIEEGATQRKAILNRFLDLDIFEKIFKLANDDLNAWTIKGQRFRNVNWLETKKAIQLSVHSSEEKIRACQSNLQILKAEQEKVRDWLRTNGVEKSNELLAKKIKLSSQVDTLQSEITRQLKMLEQTNTRLTSFSPEIAELDFKLAALPSEDELLARKAELESLNRSVTELNLKLQGATHKLDAQTKSVRKLDLVPCGDMFPTCHYIKDSHNDKAELEAQRRLVSELKSTYDKYAIELEQLQNQKAQKVLDERKLLANKIAALHAQNQSASAEAGLLSSHINSNKSTLAALIDELDSVNVALAASTDQESIKVNVARDASLTREITASELALKQSYQQLGADENKLEQLAKDAAEAALIVEEQKSLDAVCRAFCKTGIPAYVLKERLPQINAELDHILAGIVPFRVLLETEVGANSLEVYIEDRNSRRVIELASGMEKMIASLAMRVALINVSSLPKPDIFIADEGWDMLDEINCNKAIELLQTLKNRFRTILIVSHVTAMKEAADAFITVVDNDGESYVVC